MVSGRVHFRKDPIESVSRPIFQRELELLQSLEDHSNHNDACYKSLHSFPPTSNCAYCRDLIRYILSRFESQHCSRYLQKTRPHCHPTFVEIPRRLTVARLILATFTGGDLDHVQTDGGHHKATSSAAPMITYTKPPSDHPPDTSRTRRAASRHRRSAERYTSTGCLEKDLSICFRRLILTTTGSRHTYTVHTTVKRNFDRD